MRLLVTGGAGYVGSVRWRPTQDRAQLVSVACDFVQRMPDG